MSLPDKRSVSARACSSRTPAALSTCAAIPSLLRQQPEQQVLCADVGVVQLTCLTHRALESCLGSRRIRQVGTRGDGSASLNGGLDRLAQVLGVGVEIGQHGRRYALALTDHSQENVLRSEEHTSELQSLAYLVCRLLLEKKKNTLLRFDGGVNISLGLPILRTSV